MQTDVILSRTHSVQLNKSELISNGVCYLIREGVCLLHINISTLLELPCIKLD